MTEPPKLIWVDYWAPGPRPHLRQVTAEDIGGATEYVRADDHAALREAADKLADACRKWVKYAEQDWANEVLMVQFCGLALEATRAALAAHKEATE